MRVVDRHQAVDAVLSYNSRIGSGLPIASSASGWAYLASLGDAERQKFIARIAKEQSDLWRSTEPLFQEALVRYRKQGVIVSTGSFHRGITTVAIPISREKSGATYPLYCSAISEAITDEVITQRLAPMMKKIADELRVVLIAR
jgi:DNA-binding IclR family transcriptional regulator